MTMIDGLYGASILLMTCHRTFCHGFVHACAVAEPSLICVSAFAYISLKLQQLETPRHDI